MDTKTLPLVLPAQGGRGNLLSTAPRSQSLIDRAWAKSYNCFHYSELLVLQTSVTYKYKWKDLEFVHYLFHQWTSEKVITLNRKKELYGIAYRARSISLKILKKNNSNFKQGKNLAWNKPEVGISVRRTSEWTSTQTKCPMPRRNES